jgi:quinate dehydrogenase
LRLQFPTLNIPCEASYRHSRKRASPAGLVIGGGASARSAIYALSLLGLHPIFLLNRDDEEIEFLMGFFPNLKKKKGLIYLKNPTDVVKYLAKPISPVVLMVVGAIRA